VVVDGRDVASPAVWCCRCCVRLCVCGRACDRDVDDNVDNRVEVEGDEAGDGVGLQDEDADDDVNAPGNVNDCKYDDKTAVPAAGGDVRTASGLVEREVEVEVVDPNRDT